MARIAGVNLPNQKRLEVGLTYIYGIGRSTSQKVLAELGLSLDTKVKDLTEEEVRQLREMVDDLLVEGDLRRDRSQNVKRLMEIGSYKGLRHRRGLPANGQRTKTNARSRMSRPESVMRACDARVTPNREPTELRAFPGKAAARWGSLFQIPPRAVIV